MRAKIRKRGKRWYLSTVNAVGEETAHGGFPTRREARERAEDLGVDFRRGKYVPPSDLTVRDYLIEEWLPSRENADISATTRATDHTVVESWILPHIGNVPLQSLSARDLDRLYRTLRKRGGRGGKSLRGKSVRNVHVTLSKALGDAVRRGHLVVNPILAVDPPARDDSVERAAWTREEVGRFLEAAAADRLHAVWRLALASGLRRGELLGAQWADIAESTVHVRRQVLVHPRKADGPRVFVREATKTRKARRVRIDKATAAALRKWKAEQAEERLAFGAPWRTDGGLGIEADWICTEPSGHVIHPDTLLGRWKALVKRSGVTPIGLHGARHSYATLALGAGVRLDIVSRQLGHASISTTANVYSHDDAEAAQEAAEAVARMLEGR